MIRAADLVVGPWGARFLGRRIPCAHGRGGIVPASAKREGDGATPAGTWRITGLRHRPDRIAAEAEPIGPRDGWSEDPADPAYNRAIRHPHPFPAERMRRADRLYDLLAVTDHNADPVIPGAGSAIFLHCWRKPRHPTAGCIAFRRPDLEWILARWAPWSRIVIRARGGLG